MTTATALREARAVMERLGFCRGSYQDSSGAVCVLGALSQAWAGFMSVPWWEAALQTFSLAARGDADYGVADANDNAKDAAEVLAALEAAAQIAESAALTDRHFGRAL